VAPDNTPTNQYIGAAMVIGGGIAGIQASLDMAESGIKVYLVERSSAIGGHMAQLDKTFPTNDCAMCIISPKLAEAGRHLNIDILTNTQVEAISGQAGSFRVTVRRQPRYVDMQKCTACGECAKVCPVTIPNEFQAGLSDRRAAYKLYPQATPNAYAIDKLGTAPCRDACPIHQRAQGYIALIAERRFADAYQAIRADNPFPSVCGRICNHKCETACSRSMVDGSVSIMALKRFVADWWLEKEERVAGGGGQSPAANRQSRIAIVGSGPAGLTAAQDLALAGYPVTVFEALPVPGGMMRVGIPEYRLPRDVLQREIDDILALGVELRLNSPVTDLQDLFGQGYRAVFLAVGAHKSQRLEIDGDDFQGVLPGIDFLRQANLASGEIRNLGRVAVIGGGNTAIDCARTAKRLGASEISIVYRRSRAEMPADPREIDEAEHEGVKLVFLTAPAKVAGQDGKVTGLTCIRMQLGEPDASGRRRPVPIPGSDFTLPMDTVIAAVSQSPDLSLAAGLTVTRSGAASADETLATNLPGVFVGGDAATGPAFVVDAIAAGHLAARSMANYLRRLDGEAAAPSEVSIPPVTLTQQEVDARLERGEIVRRARAVIPTLPVGQRTGFGEVDLPFTEDQAVAEAERCLSCGLCSECLRCVEACLPKAITAETHGQLPVSETLHVGAVVLATGFETYDARLSEEFGFGRFPNVVTSLQFERILSASGPTEGHVRRPSDGKEPVKVAWLQCIGSRDQTHAYCSSVCCMYATKEAVIAKEHARGIQPTIFLMDMRAFGKGFDAYFERAQKEHGVVYNRCRISMVRQEIGTGNLVLRYQDEAGELRDETFDLVVLSVGLEPAKGAEALACTLGIERNKHGFAGIREFAPLETSRPGIFAAGPAAEPMDIPESVMQGSSAAAKVASLLAPARDTLTRERQFPPERDVSAEPPRIGAFICRCGINIAGVVDVPSVVEYAKTLPGVAWAEESMFTCSQDSLRKITDRIREQNLNRVIVASCTPRTHEPLFMETIREGGLNPFLFEMANIRDQDSWVHARDHDAATRKAKALVRMSVARAALLDPLNKQPLPLTHDALVIGGGPSGMTAALTLANAGFPVHLVEKEKALGGQLRNLYTTLAGGDPQAFMQGLIKAAEEHPGITVYRDAEVVSTGGFVGNYNTTILKGRSSANGDRKQVAIEHGAVVVATGGQEYRGPEYALGKDPRVVTQQQLEGTLNKGELGEVKSVVMIQCVGPWDSEHATPRPTPTGLACAGSESGDVSDIVTGSPSAFYCSRTCCGTAVKHAIALKDRNPETQIFILCKDMRTYGFKEDFYTQAREKGVIFVRFDDASKPALRVDNGKLTVKVNDRMLQEELILAPDLVVLSEATIPSEGAEALSPLFKIPMSREGFFLEAHVKLRPVDFPSEGMYLSGLAHYPKYLDEAIAQGYAAAARAATVLSKKELWVGGIVAVVDELKCTGCLTCVRVCPYDVPVVDYERTGVGGIKGSATINVAACQGCGVCVAECPAKAIQLMHYRDDQVIAKADALLMSR
jgi:heterodisulfide reductase subunit A-like polyferredoxin